MLHTTLDCNIYSIGEIINNNTAWYLSSRNLGSVNRVRQSGLEVHVLPSNNPRLALSIHIWYPRAGSTFFGILYSGAGLRAITTTTKKENKSNYIDV